MSLDKHGLLLFEGKWVSKKDEVKQCFLKLLKKSNSVDYMKLWKRVLDVLARSSHRGIFNVAWNDVEYIMYGQVYK